MGPWCMLGAVGRTPSTALTRITMSPLLAAALVLAAPAPAEDFGAARARVLAPYLDDQTFVVLRYDVTKIDALLKLFADVGAMDPDDLSELNPQFSAHPAALKKAGCREMYDVYSLTNRAAPYAVVPLAEGTNVKALTDLLRQGNAATPNPPQKLGAA